MDDKARQLFEYLLAVNSLRLNVIRDYNEYDKSWTKQVLQDFGTGVFLFGTGEDEEAILEIHRQKLTEAQLTPPKPDKKIREWITYSYSKETQPPQFPSSRYITKGQEKVEVKFEENPTRVNAFREWSEEWNRWAQEITRVKKVQTFYELFFRIHQDFQNEGEGLELLLGKTLFTWKRDLGSIKHPLFTTKLDIDFDADKGIITVSPANQGYKLELNMLSGIPLPNMEQIQNIGKLARYKDDYEEDINDLSNQFMQLVDAGGRTARVGDVVTPTSNATAHIDEYVMILRKKDNQVLKNDLEQTVEMMQSDDYEVPATISSIVGNEVKESEMNHEKWSDVGTELYFPLAANEEQKDIARRLASNYGLTVQGPPGTGKTHTIANIVSHLLAHGKKVLITSQKENPLKVLKDKIPEEIRDLCVPVLGGGKDSLREIEKSIRTISEKLGNSSPEKLKSEITRNKSELDKSRRKEVSTKHRLMEYSKNETTEIEFKGNTLTKMGVAKKLKDEVWDYQWIKDYIPLDSSFPLTEEEFVNLWNLNQKIKKDELNLQDLELPPLDCLKESEVMKEWLNLGQDLKTRMEKAIVHTDKFRYPIDNDYADLMKNKLTDILSMNRYLIKETPFNKILDDILAGESRKERWELFFNEIKELNKEIADINRTTISMKFDLPAKPSHEIEAALYILGERLRQNKKPNALFGLTKGKHAKFLWESPILNGEPLRNSNDVEVVQQHMLLERKKDDLVRIWNANLEEVSGKGIEREDKRLISTVDKNINEFGEVITLAVKIEKLKELSKRVSIPYSNWLEVQVYQDLLTASNCVKDVLRYQQWEKEYHIYKNTLEQLAQIPNAHPINKRLSELLEKHDVINWTKTLDEISKLSTKKQEVLQLISLLNKFGDIAPRTSESILGMVGTDVAIPQAPSYTWELKALHDWMFENKDTNVEQMENQIKEEQEYQKKLITSIVSNSTWLNQIQRITEKQKRALVAWKNFIKRYGKGTGNNKRYLTDARAEMEKAQSAIPVWIMPVNQVIENFPIYNEKFDVIIFDESSQCDIMSVPVLLRGEKVVVVGDDEQISPYGIGTKDAEIEELIQRYLEGVPNKRLFDHKISLYEIADQIFPKTGRLMLKEHFRCVPEIIQFSNDLSYGGQMVPLRLPFEHEKIDPPVMAIKVKEGYATEGSTLVNEPEADKIVEDIQQILNNPKYDNQTIGVITLQGHKQAALIENKIREVISESEFIKRKIICGNAYSLQGDERDIIFLSLVVAGNRRFVAMTKKEHQQTFNVAASRAKNQMRLYHSVELDELSKDCYRYRLLSYCKNPTRVNEAIENIEQQCDSPFEIDVLRMIIAKGYKVQPQVKVGKNRIDFVVEGVRARLAVECDGEKWHGPEKWEEDMQRQYDLERAGWKFWRVRGRAFYYNRVTAMEGLWKTLNELGIEPMLISSSEPKPDKKRKNNHLNIILKQGELIANTPSTTEGGRQNYKNEEWKMMTVEEEEISKVNRINALEEKQPFEKTIFNLYNYLTQKELEVFDQREKGGRLWVSGGMELEDIMADLKKKGFNFTFTENGSKTTLYKPGWYTTNK
ncbi:AAA domain-containing protein [Rossellomorea marisflavi]|uniref:AAA domain-containing protein n=1 Tax=Rossellomorea marisflavi TaxID=189381 RepID=UPI003D2C080D